MKEFLKKLTSRKLWLAIAGIVSGIAIIFGVEPNTISTIAGAVVSVFSAVSYIIVEGKIDAEKIKKAVEDSQEAIELFTPEEVKSTGGALLSPDDPRDYRLTAGAEAPIILPIEYATWQPPVENQGSTGNCVAQSCANILECIDHKLFGKHTDYSVGYIYGSPLNTVARYGMYPREACDILLKEGDVHRSVWECTYENPLCKNNRVKADHSKAQKRVKEYVRLYGTYEIQKFIKTYDLPVMIIANSSVYDENSTGTHATVCYGWKDNGGTLLVTNSWGAYWDGDGRCEIDPGHVLEAWGIVPMVSKAMEFSDLPEGHWAHQYVKELYLRGAIEGFPDGTFKPNEPITRAQWCALQCRLYDVMK